MAEFFTALKSARTEGDSSGELLNPVKTSKTENQATERPAIVDDAPRKAGTALKTLTPQGLLDTIRSGPDLDELLLSLDQLRSGAFRPEFDIHSPGPLQARIISTLLNTTLPDFWPSLKYNRFDSLIHCLRNVAGLNAVIANLRRFSSEDGHLQGNQHSRSARAIEDLLEVASHLFAGDTMLLHIRRSLHIAVTDQVKEQMSWKELVHLVSSGKVISAVAQAEDATTSPDSSIKPGWLGKGSEYATWLGRNMAALMSSSLSIEDSHVAAAQVLSRSLNLGYSKQLLAGFFTGVFSDTSVRETLRKDIIAVLKQLSTPTKRSIVEQLLRWLSGIVNDDAKASTDQALEQSRDTVGVASLLDLIMSADEILHNNVVAFLADPTLSSLLALPVRRACIAVQSSSTTDTEHLTTFLEKTMSTFNDQLFIAHAPVLHQEVLAQTLLLTAGCLHRKTPMALLMTARSSNHMQGVSNRLDSSNTRARWLGMVVGTAISSLVDKEGTQMAFGTDDMQSEEAMWYMRLVNVDDKVGQLRDFGALLQAQRDGAAAPKRPVRQRKVEDLPKIDGKPIFGPPRPPAQTEVIGEKVTELSDDESEDEEDGLKPYAKPDSDPEDSDEDATLVNRNKARAPVYIRDLMAMLRDDQNYDRFQLGIKHAAALIRRKANFGAEVKDHAEELGVILCNLHNPFDIEDFDGMRLQAMIAVLLSDVRLMAPWFSKQAFIGDYSIAQRCIILSTLGLGGRELAGFKTDAEFVPVVASNPFPSKRLPQHLHSIYDASNTSTRKLEAATKSMEQALIKPLALQAADKSTAHLNAVKVHTFSSRMEVERTKRKPAPNALAMIFGQAFFFPLVGRYQQEIAAYGSSSVYASVAFVLVTYIKTIALLLHASGPATIGLIEINGELWDLLLSLRVQAVGDISVMHAVLFALLTILEMNTDKRHMVDEHPKRLMETQQWVDMVFDRLGGSSDVDEHGDEAKVKTLAAGVLMKCKEIIDAYQKELVGY